jgi:asparagine synthase (glutamine-hydrolysing)
MKSSVLTARAVHSVMLAAPIVVCSAANSAGVERRMCGIAGIWNLEQENSLSRVRSMLTAMRHRGPDGEGSLEYRGGAAGMVRLALVDLSTRGQQPLWSEDRQVAILYNGEVYNFRAERKRLESCGHRFYSNTDTEVVLHLYLEHGLRFHEHLRGMYALAIFDWRRAGVHATPELLLARDSLGVKPLYVFNPNGNRERVVFSSELRSLLASGLVPRSIDSATLTDFLSLGFVPQPQTLIRGVRMLEPGTLEHYLPGRAATTQQFWHIPAYEPRTESLEEAAARLRGVLEESVSLHSMADAPVGAFLSGGIDSTGIAGLMRKYVRELRTYTLRFPDVAGSDESAEAESAARDFGAIHQTVDVTAREIARILPTFAGDMDQPSKDGLNTWLVSRAAAHDVKGVLSGVGGDEWFAGYPVTRRMARYASTWGGRLQRIAGHMANAALPWLPDSYLSHRAENLSYRRNGLTTWLQTHRVFPAGLAQRLTGETSKLPLEHRFAELVKQSSDNWRKETPVGLSGILDTQVFMRQQLLRDSDAASMAHSLELRVPLVDIKLAEFARSCQDAYRLSADGGNSDRYAESGSKRVLIAALRDVLPPAIANRKKKGFSLPFDVWLKGSLRPLVEDTCGEESIRRRGLLDPECCAHICGTEHLAAYPGTWTLMIFELWCRAVLDNRILEPRESAVIHGVA